MKTLRDMAGTYLSVASDLWGLKTRAEIEQNALDTICIVCNCMKPRVVRNDGGSRPMCHVHMQQVKTARCPELVTFHNLKNNARRRRIQFALTIEQWRAFCAVTGYARNRTGKRGGLLSVDRIDPNKGYSYDNIQAISLTDNILKMHREKPRKKTIRGGRVIILKPYEAKEETEDSIIDRI